jgi:hypothetical protein
MSPFSPIIELLASAQGGKAAGAVIDFSFGFH